MIDIVVIRDPDASNDICVFGDVEDVVRTFDIDLGYADLSDAREFAEWAESRAIDAGATRTGKAATLIASIVRETAENYGHDVPGWAS